MLRAAAEVSRRCKRLPNDELACRVPLVRQSESKQKLDTFCCRYSVNTSAPPVTSTLNLLINVSPARCNVSVTKGLPMSIQPIERQLYTIQRLSHQLALPASATRAHEVGNVSTNLESQACRAQSIEKLVRQRARHVAAAQAMQPRAGA